MGVVIHPIAIVHAGKGVREAISPRSVFFTKTKDPAHYASGLFYLLYNETNFYYLNL